MAEQIVIALNTTAQGTGVQQTVAGLMRVQQTADRLGNSLTSLARRFVVGLIPTITIVGMARFAQQTIENADAMGKAAQKAGETVREFSALAEIGKMAGVSVENLTIAAKALPEWLEKTGQTGKNLSQVLLEQADVFSRMPDSLEKTRLATEMFGRSGQNLIPVLNQGSEALRKQIEEATAFGVIIGPKFAKDANQFTDNLQRVLNLFRGIANHALAAVIPAINGIVDSFLKWIKETNAHLPAADYLIHQFKMLGVMLTVAGAGFDLVRIQYLALSNVLKGDFKAGWTEAVTDVQKTFENFVSRMAGIGKMGRKPDFGGDDDFDDAPAIRLHRQKAALARNEMDMIVAKNSLGFEVQQREEVMLSLMRERVNLLDQIHKLQDGDQAAQDSTMKEFVELLRELEEMEPDTFFERISEGITKLTDEFNNLAASIGDVMVNGIKRSIDTVADGMWAVIDGTATWGQLFTQVARSIISDLVKIALQEFALDGIKRGLAVAWKAFKSALGWSEVIEENAQETAKTPAKVANATLESVQSYGVAAIVGLAAMAAVMASAGAFAEGGVVVGGEQLIRVNERGQEAVLNARATSMLGESTIDSLNAGSMPETFAGGGGGTGEVKISVAVLIRGDKQALREWHESAEGQKLVVDTYLNNRGEIG